MKSHKKKQKLQTTKRRKSIDFEQR